jgi:uncharacterized protein (DUF2141 family)
MNLRVLLLVASGLVASAHAQSEGGGNNAAAPEPPAVSNEPASAVAPEPAPPTVASVHVIAENVEPGKGTVWFALCSIDLSVEGCPYKKSARAAADFVEVTFEDVPPGDYAVAGYQDVNDNGIFDKILGVPREPYALSGAAGDMLVPTFEDAVIQIKPGANDVIVHLKRLGG